MRARSCCCAASGLLAGVVAQAVDGRMPADQETIRYTGFYGTDADGKPFLSREVLGGGSGGRYYADGNDAIHIVPGLAQPAGRVHRDALSACWSRSWRCARIRAAPASGAAASATKSITARWSIAAPS